MPPRLSFPQLPDGAHRDLLLLLHQMRSVAGEPSMRAIAEGMSEDDDEISCSHTTIHKIFSGREVPTNLRVIYGVAKWLNDRNPRRSRDEDELFNQLDDLWTKATAFQALDVGQLPALDAAQLASPGEFPGPSGGAGTLSDEAGANASPAQRRGAGGPTESRAEPGASTRSTGKGQAPPTTTAAARKPGGTLLLSRPEADQGSRSPLLPALETSRALLIGGGNFVHDLPPLPAVRAGVQGLADVLSGSSPDSAFTPQHTRVMHDPTRLELLDAVTDVSRQAEDTLLLYFAGHGLVSNRGELLLAGADTTAASAEFTAAPYDMIRNLLADSPARRSLVVLDACFTGRAINALMGPLDGLADAPSTFLLTSTGANTASFASDGNGYTAFTGALLDVMRRGIPGQELYLTIDAIASALARTSALRGIPQPRFARTGSAGSLALGRNPGYVPQGDLLAEWGIRDEDAAAVREAMDRLRGYFENPRFTQLYRPLPGLARNRWDLILDGVPQHVMAPVLGDHAKWMANGARACRVALGILGEQFPSLRRPGASRRGLQESVGHLYQALLAAERAGTLDKDSDDTGRIYGSGSLTE